MISLHEIAEQARIALPDTDYKQGGSRIDAALALAESGQVVSLGTMPVTGHDYWMVGNYTVSISGKSCTCPDHAAPIYKDGKLCKHRLAAMMIHRVTTTQARHLERVLREAPAASEWLTLRVNVYYITGGGRAYTLTGHHYPGSPWERYAADDCFDFTEELFTTALKRTGWQVDGRPSKQGIAYHYRLVPAGSTATAGMYGLNATDHETLERQDTNRRMNEILERVLERTAA